MDYTYKKNGVTRIIHVLLSVLLLSPFYSVVSVADGAGIGNGANGGSGSGGPDGPPCSSCCNGGGGGDNRGPSGNEGDPINIYYGREVHTLVDMVVQGVYPIRIQRRYDSQSIYDSPLGYGWAFLHDRRIFEYPDNSVVIRYGCGQRDRIVMTGGAYQTSSSGFLGDLIENTDGTFEFRYNSGAIDYYDAQGLLVAEQNAKGHRLEYTYSSTKLPLQGASPWAIDPHAPMTVALNYQLQLIRERLADGTLTGNQVTFQYSPATGRLTSITSHDGRVVTYQHDVVNTNQTLGNLIKVIGLEGVESNYLYEDPNDIHNVTSIQDVAGTTPYVNTYDAQDRVVTQTHGNYVLMIDYSNPAETSVTKSWVDVPGGPTRTGTTKYTFNADSYVDTKIDMLGNETRYTYTAKNLIQRKEIWQKNSNDPLFLLQAVDYTYYPDGNTHTETVVMDSGEIVTKTWTYEDGLVASEQTISSARPMEIFHTEYTYYDTNNVPTSQSGSGPASRVREEKRRRADGSFQTTTYTYNADGQVASVTLPDGVKQIHVYAANSPYLERIYFEDASGNALSHLEQRFQYNNKGQKTDEWDANNNHTQYVYDDKNRVEQIINARGEHTLYTYTDDKLELVETGRLVSGSTITEGQITRLIYDSEQRLEKVQRKNDSGTFIDVMTYTYSSRGDRITQTDVQNRTTTFGYDNESRLISVEDPAQKLTQYEYDAVGNRSKMIDAKNRETVYTYNDLNRLVQIVQDATGLNAVTVMTYDAAGNLLTVTDPENSTTTYTYDRLSRRTAVTQPLTQQVQTFYTTRDQVDYVINGRGHKIDYSYFPWGGLEKVEYFNTVTDTTVQRTVSYAYDNNGNITNVIDDSIQATPLYTFTYDVLNRPDQTTMGYLPSSVTLNNDYDRYGNRNQFTLNDGSAQVHSFNYNKLNQLTGATLPGSQVFGFDYYDEAGSLRTLTYPSGITTDYQYEDNGPVKQILTRRSDGTTVIEQLDYTYDDVLNVDTLTSANDGTYDYGYDPLDHLTSADYPSSVENQGITDETFQYDKVGNRINAEHDYNDNHQITQSPGVANYSFDADGNMVTKAGGFVFGYNPDNRLTSFTDANNSTNDATYRYDPFGRRVSKTIDGTTIYFVWDGARLVGEYIGGGPRTKRYAYLPSRLTPIQVEDANGIYNAHYDHLDTPRFLTDMAQIVVWSQKQEAFGRFFVNRDPDGNSIEIVYNARFPGQWEDVESGLSYNYFRTYDPTIGRYIQGDPIGLMGGINLFVYALNNPVSFIDFLGLSTQGGTGPKTVKKPNPYTAAGKVGCEIYNYDYKLQQQGLWENLQAALRKIDADYEGELANCEKEGSCPSPSASEVQACKEQAMLNKWNKEDSEWDKYNRLMENLNEAWRRAVTVVCKSL